MTNYQIGSIFEYTTRALWSGPCAACGRTIARKRACKGEAPCANHAPVKGFETQRLRAVIVELTDTYIGHRAIKALSIDNPMPGTKGRDVSGGGFNRAHFDAEVEAGAITLS